MRNRKVQCLATDPDFLGSEPGLAPYCMTLNKYLQSVPPVFICVRNSISGILECGSSFRHPIDDMKKMVPQEKGRVVNRLSLVIPYKDSASISYSL